MGRKSELRAIANRIFGTGGFGSLAVVGLPRVGKTSLVAEAIRRAKEDRAIWHRTVVARVNVGTAESAGGLFRVLVGDLGESIRDQGGVDATVGERIAEVAAAPEVDFGAVRRAFKALRRADIRPVCVLDEFDAGRRVFEDAPQSFHWLRELCSNPEFKAAVVLVAKRRLRDVARLAGQQSDYWANVLMTLSLKPWSHADVREFFSRLEKEGVALSDTEQSRVMARCGGHPYLLEVFAYHAWNSVQQGGGISVEWIDATCKVLVGDYFGQVSTVLEDGPMLAKAVQVFVGPQRDVSSADVEALCELGIALREGEGGLRGFSRAFEEYLRSVDRSIDVWPLWRETERALRDALEDLALLKQVWVG